VKDGEYEISLYSKCVSSGMTSPPPGLDDYRSLAITGSIDRVAPVRFGYAKPVVGSYSPGDDISIAFNEEINCRAPFTFRYLARFLNTTSNTLKSIIDPFVVNCEGRELQFAFSTKIPVKIESNHDVVKEISILYRNLRSSIYLFLTLLCDTILSRCLPLATFITARSYHS